MDANRKTPLLLWLVPIASIALCVQPFNFKFRMVGFVLATIGGFSVAFLRRQVGRNRFIIFELLFITAIAVFFINSGTI